MTKHLHLESNARIIVMPPPSVVKKMHGKTVDQALKHGMSPSILRSLERDKIIRFVPHAANKTALIISMLKQPRGVTRSEALAIVGWKAISFQQVGEKKGVAVKVDNRRRPFRYRAVR